MGQLIIVSSVSGAGKTTLVDKASVTYNLYKLKTCTTRAVRPEETGNEYYFYGIDEFMDNVECDEFVEHAEVYGNHYGLLKTELRKADDTNCIVIMDVQGAASARALYPDAVSIFIDPPSIEELKLRILKRNTGEGDTERRLAEIDSEMEQMKFFTYVVKNGSLPYMSNQFNDIIEKTIDVH